MTCMDDAVEKEIWTLSAQNLLAFNGGETIKWKRGRLWMGTSVVAA